jgi:dCTP deaminase
MLGAAELKRRIGLGKADPTDGVLIVPAPEATGELSPGTASVDLRLGRWFLTIQQSKTSVIDLGQARSSEEFEAAEGRMFYVPFGSNFIVHPGRFVLGSTLEWVRVPETLGGFITGKSTIGRRGLVIETAAGLHLAFQACKLRRGADFVESWDAYLPSVFSQARWTCPRCKNSSWWSA